MKLFCYYLLIFAYIFYTDAERNIRSIASGTSFGECLGYCQQAINITSRPSNVLATKRSNGDDKTYPPLQKRYRFPQKQWNELIALVNLERIRALPNRIGCPDCADGGAEWIEIDATDGTKRVTFEYGSSVEGIETFLARIRKLREKYLTRLN